MTGFWTYRPGYYEARNEALFQDHVEDLRLIGSLYGAGGLRSGASIVEIKVEAMRQLAVSYRDEFILPHDPNWAQPQAGLVS